MNNLRCLFKILKIISHFLLKSIFCKTIRFILFKEDKRVMMKISDHI